MELLKLPAKVDLVKSTKTIAKMTVDNLDNGFLCKSMSPYIKFSRNKLMIKK